LSRSCLKKSYNSVHIDLVSLVIAEARSVWRGLEYLITTLCYLNAALFLSLPVSNFMDFSHAANNSGTASPNSDDLAVVRQGNSALSLAKRNFSYLMNPTKSADHSERLRTSALLRTLNYVGRYIFWRLVRYAKYVAIGSLVAAVGATAFGT
jgi:hypothetical protein